MPRLTVTALSIALLAVTPALGRSKPVEATPIGKAIDCINTRQIRETRVRDDSTIDFIMNGRDKVYRNTLPYSCSRLGFEEKFLYRTQIGQLCSVDTITVLSTPPSIGGPTCGLGKFTPVRITPAKPTP
jgi:hypothetical protein